MKAFTKLLDLLRPVKGKRVALIFVNYAEGDRLIRLNQGWEIATKEEDHNKVFGMVWLEKRKPI